jgi:hypothetical protein
VWCGVEWGVGIISWGNLYKNWGGGGSGVGVRVELDHSLDNVPLLAKLLKMTLY